MRGTRRSRRQAGSIWAVPLAISPKEARTCIPPHVRRFCEAPPEASGHAMLGPEKHQRDSNLFFGHDQSNSFLTSILGIDREDGTTHHECHGATHSSALRKPRLTRPPVAVLDC
jgi:hypothetical protein